ncbi:discoidin domain-containing protein [Gracilibacillus sp. JCM 18860]|uniref:discoidin domain-containing protein n=1 Tax=Gracilibacillus sp. JCM 18860 TaxID=1306159 RepID=UPI0032611E6A
MALQENDEEYPAASASFTGQWDDVDRINDGDYSSNRWTNWDPNEWREKDWIQIDFGKTEAISEVRFTFYDDEGGTRPPESLYLEYWNGSDWTKIKNSDAIIEDKDEKTITFDEITTSKIRAQLKAMPETCIAVVEMEVMGVGGDSPIIGEDATLTNILVNEEKLEGFRSDQFTYELEVEKETDIPSIIVTPTDLFATYEVVLPDSVPGKASIIVTSEDQENTNTYQVHFTVKQQNPPDDGKGRLQG